MSTDRTEFPQRGVARTKGGNLFGWKAVKEEMPDSDMTVLIHHPDEDEPVWLGYHDGKTWRTAEGVRVAVTHWQDLPEAPPRKHYANHA